MGVYVNIMRTPGVGAIVFATLIGRLPIGISGLAILLYVREVTGSFAAAGGAAGALALGSALGAPFQGRVVDRRGIGSLVPLASLHALGLLSVWGAGAADAPAGVLALVALLTGVVLPPLSSVLRSRWPYLLVDRPELIPSAFALDSVIIEVIFVGGPLLTTVVVATLGPQYALIVSAAAVLAGTLLLVARLAGQPGPERTGADVSAFGIGALAAPGLRTLVLASLPVGFALGSVEVVLPAFSEAQGSRDLAGVFLAVWAGASGAAGLLWGALAVRFNLIEWHLRFACLLPLAIAPLLLASSPLSMVLFAAIAGLPIAPLIASRNQLVDSVVVSGTATEAFTWPLTALVTGVSAGAAVAGALIEASSWTAGTVVAVAVAGLGSAVVLTRRHTLGRPLPA